MDDTVARALLQDYTGGYLVADRGLRVSEVVGDPLYFNDAPSNAPGQSLVAVVPELIGCESELQAVGAGELDRFELPNVNRVVSADKTVCLTFVALPHVIKPGEVAGLVLRIDNVTDFVNLTEELAQSRSEVALLQQRELLDKEPWGGAYPDSQRTTDPRLMFFGAVSHELLMPLGSVAGYLETLLDEDYGPLTAIQREYLEIAQSSTARLIHITRNLLDMTRLQSGHTKLLPVPVALASVVQAVAAEFQPTLDERRQHLVLRIAPNTQNVLSDEARIYQIVGNLLENASKYSPQDGVITLTVEPSADADHVQLAVQDTGIGIPREEHSRLFEPFFRSRNAIQSGESGAGLGLYITRFLVLLQGGRIWLESEVGVGSTFYVSFPTASITPPSAGPSPEDSSGPLLRVLRSRSHPPRKSSDCS